MKPKKFIAAKTIFLYFIILRATTCIAQDDKIFSSNNAGILLGIQTGIGKDAFKTITSPANSNFDLEYFSSKRYKHPAARIRIYGDLRMSKIFSMGLQTGATIHFSENYYGVIRNKVTIPLQGALKFEILHQDNIKAGINLYSGFNLQRIKWGYYEERSGSLITMEMAVKWGKKINSIISGGVEYQQDHNRYYLDGDSFTIPLKDDIIKFKTDRWQVYLGYGIEF